MEEDSKSYKEIVNRILKKDEDAAVLFFEMYRDSLRFFILKVSSFKLNETDDVLQEVFIKFLKSVRNNSYNPSKGKLSTFLFTLAKNCCIDMFRKEKTKHKENTVSIYGENNDESPDDVSNNMFIDDVFSDDAVLNKELRFILLSWLSLLPESHRELINAYYFKQLKYDEICKETNLKLGTLKTRLFRAKQALKEIANQYPEGYTRSRLNFVESKTEIIDDFKYEFVLVYKNGELKKSLHNIDLSKQNETTSKALSRLNDFISEVKEKNDNEKKNIFRY